MNHDFVRDVYHLDYCRNCGKREVAALIECPGVDDPLSELSFRSSPLTEQRPSPGSDAHMKMTIEESLPVGLEVTNWKTEHADGEVRVSYTVGFRKPKVYSVPAPKGQLPDIDVDLFPMGNHRFVAIDPTSLPAPSKDYLVVDLSPKTCECGSDKAKLPTHSSWCPKHV